MNWSRQSILFFIEYFIINDGVMWQTILNILEKKAKEGVDVRLIYDGYGCLTTLPYKYDQEMRRRGSNAKYSTGSVRSLILSRITVTTVRSV